MNYAELNALAALAACEAICMEGENALRAQLGQSPAYRDGTGFMQFGELLRDEVHRRIADHESARKEAK